MGVDLWYIELKYYLFSLSFASKMWGYSNGFRRHVSYWIIQDGRFNMAAFKNRIIHRRNKCTRETNKKIPKTFMRKNLPNRQP